MDNNIMLQFDIFDTLKFFSLVYMLESFVEKYIPSILT